MRSINLRGSTNRGSAVVMALMVMMLLGVIGTGLAVFVRTEMLIAQEFRDGTAAYYLAEAGAKRAIIELSGNSAWPGLNSWVNMDAAHPEIGQYQVKVEQIAGLPVQRKVVAYGKFKAAERQVVVWLTLPSTMPPVTSIRVDSWHNF